MSDHDVIVVGGRVAGAASALLLARAGHDVLVVERDRRGSDTLSTHALMRAGVVQLRRWGLLDEVLATGTPPQHRVVFHYGGEAVEVTPSGPLLAPRRTVLDPLLAAAAERAGATVRFRTAVQGLVVDAGRVVGVRLSGSANGATSTRTARVVVGADGRRSLVAREVDAPVTHRAGAASAAFYGHWRGVATDGYEWGFAPGSAAGLIPTNDGRVCVYAGVPPRRFLDDLRHDLVAGIHRVLAETAPQLADRVAAGRRVGPVRGFPGIRGWLRRPRGPGWALVGDAGYFKDPCTAHGISDALRDAELLARDLHAELAGEDDPVNGSYERVRDRLSRDFFDVTDAISSFAWDLDELRGLHLAMSRAMQDEVAHLAGLEPMPGGAAAVAGPGGRGATA